MKIKKILGAIAFSLAVSSSLSADYKLVLTDVDGNQTQECIKSYSFSNNLESLAKQNGVVRDFYSNEEALTNKVYFGKPVYRRVFSFDDYQVAVNNDGIYKYTSVISSDIEDIVELSYKVFKGKSLYSENNSFYAIYGNSGQYYFSGGYKSDIKKAYLYIRNNLPNETTWTMSKLKIFVEYTKTTDTADTSSNTFKSYLHYVPSSSTIDEVITKDMKNLGVQFLEGYSYNPDTSSCDKIQ